MKSKLRKLMGKLRWLVFELSVWPLHHLQLEGWILWLRFQVALARLNGKTIVLDGDYYRFTVESFHEALRTHFPIASRVFISQVPVDLCLNSMYGFFARRKLDALDRDGILAVSHDGISLAEVFRTRMCGDAGKINYQDSPVITRDYLYQSFLEAIVIYEVHKRLIKQIKPNAMLVFQGAYGLSRVLNELRHRFNLRTVAIETSFLGDRIYFDSHCGVILNRFSLAKHGREYRARNAEDEDAGLKALSMWKAALPKKIGDHQTKGISTEADFLAKYGFDLKNPYALILAQVQIDGSLLLDSHLYPNSIDFLREAVSECRDMDIPVIVRFHPREAKVPGGSKVEPNSSYHQLLKQLGGTVPDGVVLVPGAEVDTFMLVRNARLGITLNSQSGLEMALHGKPVVTAATCMYAQKGFTWDVAHPCALASSISSAWGHLDHAEYDPEIQRQAGQFILDMTRTCMPLRNVAGSEDVILRQLGLLFPSGIAPKSFWKNVRSKISLSRESLRRSVT